jgi:hypothetical protein
MNCTMSNRRLKRPNFFLIGAPKCGTTSLAAWLAQHPQVYMAPNKEPEFFNTDITLAADRSLRAYERLFDKVSAEHRAIGEASVLYLYSQVAIPNVLAYSPRPKFIVAVRDPVEMAVSLHNQELFNGNEDVADFATAWALQPERRAGRSIPRACTDVKLLLYGDICKVGAQLERLLRMVPRDDVLVLALDDLKSDPGKVYGTVLSFLGLAPDPREHFPVHNVARRRRSRAVHMAVKASRGLWERTAYSRAGRAALKLYNWVNAVEARPPPAPKHVLKELRAFFASDVLLLEEITGRRFGEWENRIGST